MKSVSIACCNQKPYAASRVMFTACAPHIEGISALMYTASHTLYGFYT